MIISHDRYFLDKVASKVIEVENHKAKVYYGNYTYYYNKKIVDREIAQKQYENQQREIKHQEEVIKKLREFNREKSIKRAESREKQLNKIDRLDVPESLPDKMHFTITPDKESGNDVLSVENVAMDFNYQNIFSDISFEVKKGDKIALIGPNGVGKTTLLRSLLGEIKPISGSVELGGNQLIGYFEQEIKSDNTNTCIDDVWNEFPSLNQGEVRGLLAKCGLTTDQIESKVYVLSGGEQAKVRLCKIMNKETNILVLDEPTNHLDVEAKDELKKAIKEFKGTVLLVCHEPEFYSDVVDDVWNICHEPEFYKDICTEIWDGSNFK